MVRQTVGSDTPYATVGALWADGLGSDILDNTSASSASGRLRRACRGDLADQRCREDNSPSARISPASPPLIGKNLLVCGL
jgi:hypothetical protein